MKRRDFLLSTAASLPLIAAGEQSLRAETTQTQPDGFFTLGKRDQRWWLLTPYRDRFFSMGLNHVDPATIRYPENIDRWRMMHAE